MPTQLKNTETEFMPNHNHTWREGNYSSVHCSSEADCDGGINHDRQPCGANFDNSQQCNLTHR